MFWLSLLSAAALYGGVALAPKLLTALNLEYRYATAQVRLVALERQVKYLEKVAQALEHDPGFAAELARLDLDAVRPGDERISVPADLHLPPPPEVWRDLPVIQPPRCLRLLEVLAGNMRLRMTLLVTAAVLVLGAFAWPHEPESLTLGRAAGLVGAAFGRLAARYRK